MIYHPPHLFLKNGCNIRIFFYTFTLQTNELLLNEDMENRSLVSIAGLSKEKILYLLEMAREFEKNPNRKIMDGRVVATLFFEPSTRTRLSFETAANRLGARVIGFTDPKVTSSSKGETLKDTIMMVRTMPTSSSCVTTWKERHAMLAKWHPCPS